MSREYSMLLKLKGVAKSYQSGSVSLEILSGLDLEIRNGESVAITGRSGSGKSTLLNLIAGLDSPTRGEIQVAGISVSHLPEESLTAYRQQTIGLVFQMHYLLKDFSALENVMLPALMGGDGRKTARNRAEDLLNQVDMYHRKDHFPNTLSGGECQRIALARSLINDPRLILADEPTGSLDEKNARVIEDILFNLVENHHKSMLYVTHNERFSRRGSLNYTLEGGRLHQ